MIHNVHTMPLGRLSLMLETDNSRLIARCRWLPGFIIRHGFIRFMTEFDKMFSEEGRSRFKREILQVQLFNKIQNTLPLLYLGLLYKPDDYLEGIYEHYFGKKPEGGKDLIRIQEEINRLSKKYLAMFGERIDRPAPEKGNFEELVLAVEGVLDRPIDRNMKVYQFKYYYDRALKQIRQWENGRHKRNI